MNYKLLSVSADAKTKKGEKEGYLTGILYMAPHTLGGGQTLCPFSTPGCRRVCLYTAGHGAFAPVQNARIRKAGYFKSDPEGFAWDLHEDILALVAEAERRGMIPCVRLNGTTDVEWERYGIMENFSDIQFYDYSKYPPNLRKAQPANYHLTYSFSEAPSSAKWAHGWWERGGNVSAVFQGELPPTFLGHPVIDGDQSDLRFLDPPGVVVGLKVKGKARHDDGDGFVQGRAA